MFVHINQALLFFSYSLSYLPSLPSHTPSLHLSSPSLSSFLSSFLLLSSLSPLSILLPFLPLPSPLYLPLTLSFYLPSRLFSLSLPSTTFLPSSFLFPPPPLQIHCWDDGTPLEETLRALNDLVVCGKVRYVGVSNVTGWQFQKIIDMSRELGLNQIVSNQVLREGGRERGK